MNLITILGLAAGTLTTISFVPQVVRVWKSRSTKDLSLGMFLLFTLGVLLWSIYGFILMQWPIILANVITLCLSCIILWFKVRYK
jgi:MtN3 and saliva related transmembrane protein